MQHATRSNPQNIVCFNIKTVTVYFFVLASTVQPFLYLVQNLQHVSKQAELRVQGDPIFSHLEGYSPLFDCKQLKIRI